MVSSFFQRVNAGYQAFRDYGSVDLSGNALLSQDKNVWDNFGSRTIRYEVYDLYYQNTAYTNVARVASWLKRNRRLYKKIRGVYNPVERLVETYVSKIYGGNIDWETMESGAIPLIGASPALLESIRKVWEASNWQTKKSLLVRTGARLGDFAIQIVDEPKAERVRFQVLNPGIIKYAEFDSVGNVNKIVLEYICAEPVSEIGRNIVGLEIPERTYIRTDIIDNEFFSTYKDGRPYAFVTDGLGREVEKWPNDYGFVPVVTGQHRDIGFGFGANSFRNQVSKIDEVNELASMINDQVFKAVNTTWAFIGVKAKKEVDVGKESVTGAERDELPALYLPENAQVPFPMVAPIDIMGALADIDRLNAELKLDLPELALPDIRSGGNLTAPGVMAGFDDAVGRITEGGSQYDEVLVKANQYAVAIGGMRGYAGFETFSLDSLQDGSLRHFVGARTVIKDYLSVKERVDAAVALKAPMKFGLKLIGASQSDIDEAVADAEARDRATARGAMEGLFDDEPAEGEDSETPAQTGSSPFA